MPTFEVARQTAADAIYEYISGAAASDAAREMQLSGAGVIAELEGKLKQHYGVRHALLVSNGTVGLFLVAVALGLKRTNFVTTPYTYGGALSGWLLLDNRPIFADIEPDTLSLEPEATRKAITPKTKALLATDIYGIPADMFALRKLADEFGIWYIADAAQSFGATRNSQPASVLADAMIVSFTSGKPISAGEGGAILTNNSELYEKLIWYGAHPRRQCRDLGLDLNNEFAFNTRPHPLGVIWANAIFEESLLKLKQHQMECFEVIRALNAIGLTEPIAFKEKNINPSFFRLTAAWKHQAQISVLFQELEDYNFLMNVEVPPAHVLYQKPEFIAQFGRRCKVSVCCPQAEHQADNRFCLVKRRV